MKVLITGANGMVAKATIKHCQEIGDEVFAYNRNELDISNKPQVLEKIEQNKPDAVINCAAYTNVDGAETNQEVCYAANSKGVENLALAAKEFDCRFVTISTDYVFDGEKEGFYTQKDTPNPKGVYAKSKYIGERLASNSYARSIIVRTGWIFGNDGTNFLSIMHNLLGEGKKIKSIKDSYGTPTFTDDLAVRLRELAELDLPGIYHIINSGEGTSYLGFTEKICEIGNFDKDLVEIISDKELNRPAPRPINSKLACLFSEKFGLSPLPSWENGIERFLSNKKSEC